ncbi:MAG: hypothetical protein DMG89_08015 [Acidobacteria bacterium]|nr:MAG: hypothetical protein DMG89_08015 [Acidobacteriota bacterium]
MRFELTLGLCERHDSTLRIIVSRKFRSSQCIEHELFQGWCRGMTIGVEALKEERQIQICPVTLRDQEPVQRHVGLFGIRSADVTAPATAELLLSPVGVVDNRVT